MTVWDEQRFRDRVSESAQRKGIATLEEVAELAGVDRKYFRADKLHASRNVRHILQIAAAIDADPAYLMGLVDQQTVVADSAPNAEHLAFALDVAAYLLVAAARKPLPATHEARKLIKRLIEAFDLGAA